MNIHPSDVEVTYDSESGMVTYVITSDDMEDVDNAISIISQDDFASTLEVADEIQIDTIESPSEVLVTVDVIADATNVDNISLAVDNVIQLITSQDESYDVNGKGTYNFFIFISKTCIFCIPNNYIWSFFTKMIECT